MAIILYENSLITLDDAECYFDCRFNSNDWYALETSEKEQLLITSSRILNRYDFVGNKKESTQPMAFPREYEIPQDIKDAICEEAYSRIHSKSNIHQKNIENNISSISLGTGSISYQTDYYSLQDKELISSTARYLVNKWVKKGFQHLI